jgi:2,4-dienoyl-CoA reductase-like NADH-dependent reductase (Old Yellow Enzyme family)
MLFEPCELSALSLPNRIVKASMTHARATDAGVQTPLDATCYGAGPDGYPDDPA